MSVSNYLSKTHHYTSQNNDQSQHTVSINENKSEAIKLEHLAEKIKVSASTQELLSNCQGVKPSCDRKLSLWVHGKNKIILGSTALLLGGLITAITLLCLPAIIVLGTLTLLTALLQTVATVQHTRRAMVLSLLKNLKNSAVINPFEYECLLRAFPNSKVFEKNLKQILNEVIERLRAETPHKDWSSLHKHLSKGNLIWILGRLNHFVKVRDSDAELVPFAEKNLAPKNYKKLRSSLVKAQTSTKFVNCPQSLTKLQERLTIAKWLKNLKNNHLELFEESENRAYKNVKGLLKKNEQGKFFKSFSILLKLLAQQAQTKLTDGYKSNLYFPDLINTLNSNKHTFGEVAKILGTDHQYDSHCQQLKACKQQIENIWNQLQTGSAKPNLNPEKIQSSFKQINTFCGMLMGQLSNESCTTYNGDYYHGVARQTMKAIQDLSEAVIHQIEQIEQVDPPHSPLPEHSACCDFSHPDTIKDWPVPPSPIKLRKAVRIEDARDPLANPVKPTTVIFSANAGNGHRSGAEAIARYIGEEHHVSVIDSQKDMLLHLDGLYRLTGGKITGEEFMNSVKQKQCWWLLKLLYWIERLFVNYDKRNLKKEQAIMKRLLRESPDLVVSPIAKLNGNLYHVCKKLKIPFIITPLDVNPTNFLQGIPNVKDNPLFALTIPYKDELVSKAVNGRISEEQIYHTGYVVNPEYLSEEALTLEETKKRKELFQIPENKQVLTIAGGGLGSLSGLQFAEKLAHAPESEFEKDLHIVICCGRDQKLIEKVNALKIRNPHITISAQPFTTELHKLLSVTDIYLPKPGGGSTGEGLSLQIITKDEEGTETCKKLFMLLDASNSKHLYWENDTVEFLDKKGRGKAVFPNDKVPDFIKKVNEALDFKYIPDPDIDGKRPDVEFRRIANHLIYKRKLLDQNRPAPLRTV